MEGVDNKVVIGSLFGLGIAALSGAALYKLFSSSPVKEKEEVHVAGQ